MDNDLSKQIFVSAVQGLIFGSVNILDGGRTPVKAIGSRVQDVLNAVDWPHLAHACRLAAYAYEYQSQPVQPQPVAYAYPAGYVPPPPPPPPPAAPQQPPPASDSPAAIFARMTGGAPLINATPRASQPAAQPVPNYPTPQPQVQPPPQQQVQPPSIYPSPPPGYYTEPSPQPVPPPTTSGQGV